jgi:hypothetical protein
VDWREKEAELKQQLEDTLETENWKWLNRSIAWEAGDVNEASSEEIMKWFGAKASPKRPDKNKVNDTRLLYTMIWQSWVKIQVGVEDPVEGNVRSYWYQTAEPFYQFHDLLLVEKVPGSPVRTELDIDSLVTELFGDFVRHRVFKYRGAFGFNRPIDALYRLGDDKAKYLFFTEKEGLWNMCKQLNAGGVDHTEPSISVMASQGQPSFVTLEFLANDLQVKKGVSNLIIAVFADGDPWGLGIAEQIDAKMRFLGFKSVTTYRLTTPDLFTPAQIAKGKDLTKVHPSQRKLVERWMQVTGGCNGEPIGLHVDVLKPGQREQLLKRFMLGLKTGKLDEMFPLVEPIDLRRLAKPGRAFSYSQNSRDLRYR